MYAANERFYSITGQSLEQCVTTTETRHGRYIYSILLCSHNLFLWPGQDPKETRSYLHKQNAKAPPQASLTRPSNIRSVTLSDSFLLCFQVPLVST